jgi:hypothetical protein
MLGDYSITSSVQVVHRRPSTTVSLDDRSPPTVSARVRLGWLSISVAFILCLGQSYFVTLSGIRCR